MPFKRPHSFTHTQTYIHFFTHSACFQFGIMLRLLVHLFCLMIISTGSLCPLCSACCIHWMRLLQLCANPQVQSTEMLHTWFPVVLSLLVCVALTPWHLRVLFPGPLPRHSRAVRVRRHHDHSVHLQSALPGCFLWHCAGNTLRMGPTQGHKRRECSNGHVKNSNGKFCVLSSQLCVPCHHQERSAVLPHPADPVGMPMGLIAPGCLTSHLRKISGPESAVGTGAYSLGSGTGSRCAASLSSISG